MTTPSSKPLALVVGAGPGIGLTAARRFAKEGYDLAIVARPSDDLKVFEADLCAAGATLIRAWAGDLIYDTALSTLLRQMDQENLAPEVLIYNASGGEDAFPSLADPDALHASFQINALAPLACAQAVLPVMRKCGRGTILFTGGGLALEPKAGQAPLSIGKAALRSLALCLAEELEPEGIHAATVTVAGWVRSGTAFSPDTVAEAFWELHREPKGAWRREVILRP